MNRLILTLAAVLLPVSPLPGHGGPDPILHWDFQEKFLRDGTLVAQRGPDLPLPGQPVFVDHGGLPSLALGADGPAVAVADIGQAEVALPEKDFTISAWASIDTPRKWGGIAGVMQDNGGEERGWVLGYNESVFSIALASEGADDGDGKMTYLTGTTRYEAGRMYHVAATFDGTTLTLFVNGKTEAATKAQSGPILYPESAPLVIGGYMDRDERYPHSGMLRSARVWDHCAKPEWVAMEFAHHAAMAQAAPQATPQVEAQLPRNEDPSGLKFVVRPYLQWATADGMTVMWETSKPSRGTVRWGESAECRSETPGAADQTIHEIRLAELAAARQYFYRVEARDDDGGVIRSPVLTLQTAPEGETPFAFAIISDTQSNPRVAAKIAAMAWGQRPSFLLHPGDLVGTGRDKSHWTDQFFPSMGPLIERVAFFPVLGNHEQNARHYYDYVSLPSPEYYYTFHYGNAQFFMIDTNKKVGPGSEQYVWLEEELARSEARWKFVCHHHPVYSSDENDYGDLWKTNRSSRGDLNARHLTTLYDKFGVDIVWNGHIHSYERTWPVKGGKAADRSGTVYMVTGGGGGGLETAGPVRPFFQNTVKHGHHYCMARINDAVLEFFAYDLEGRLFDTMKIEKRGGRKETP